jgi:hypothetical protein
MTPCIDPLSEELLYASPEAPEIARLDPPHPVPADSPADPEESVHDRPEA